MSWSRHGYENASYCISQTGLRPAMQRPTAAPSMPASASGVSKQRSGPKRSRRPAVARKTPPERPTSSPMTSTSASRSSSTWRQSFTASTRVSSGMTEVRRRVGVGVREQKLGIRLGLGLGGLDPAAHRLERLLLDRGRERVVEQAEPPEIAVVAADALAAALFLDAVEVDVEPRVVGGRVGGDAEVDGLDQRRPAAAASPLDRLPRGLVDREHVTTVHAHAGNPVAGRLVGERLRARLGGERGRDRPLVVVADEDERRARDRGEVHALVERALGRRAVTEEDERARPLAE